MTSFWKTMADVTREKLDQLGIAGSILGLVWIVGLWVWYDWMVGAYAEAVPTAGNLLGLAFVVWLLLGLGVYLWQDPHHVRAGLLD
jgi:hypothetical protein